MNTSVVRTYFRKLFSGEKPKYLERYGLKSERRPFTNYENSTQTYKKGDGDYFALSNWAHTCVIKII